MIQKIGIEASQVVAYASALDFSDKLSIAQKLRDIKAVDFGGEPTIFPLPEDAPPEIPRIILKSRDGKYALNLYLNRVDLVYQGKKIDFDGTPESLKTVNDSLVKCFLEVTSLLSREFSAKFNRAAMVVRHIAKLDESSKKLLAHTLLRADGDTPYEVRMAYLFKESMGEFKVNRWFRVETLRSKKDPKDDEALAILFDINTLPNVDYAFSEKVFQEFCNMTTKKINIEMEKFTALAKGKK